jgi:hypothetical protein
MNEWNKEQLEQDETGLVESCDRCNKLMCHWQWLNMAFLQMDGQVFCRACNEEKNEFN